MSGTSYRDGRSMTHVPSKLAHVMALRPKNTLQRKVRA